MTAPEALPSGSYDVPAVAKASPHDYAIKNISCSVNNSKTTKAFSSKISGRHIRLLIVGMFRWAVADTAVCRTLYHRRLAWGL